MKMVSYENRWMEIALAVLVGVACCMKLSKRDVARLGLALSKNAKLHFTPKLERIVRNLKEARAHYTLAARSEGQERYRLQAAAIQQWMLAYLQWEALKSGQYTHAGSVCSDRSEV